MTNPTYRRKLIEVDLPLEDINFYSKREKPINHGHPSSLHQWWARLTLATTRAVLFASMVDDPSNFPDEFTDDQQRTERQRLHGIIKRLVVWKNSNDGKLLDEARYEIARSVARSRGEDLPLLEDMDSQEILTYLSENAVSVFDPFAGGGYIPLEAQRLGMRAIASDLNPVAVLINKALIELPPKFAGQPPVNPDADPMGMFTGKHTGRGKNRKPQQVPWRGAAGLANDIRYYGKWMREKAFERIGHLYPKAKLPDGGEATVIAWLWARTVPCPNPACGVAMPLVKTFQLSTNPKNRHWTKPTVVRETNSISFEVQSSRDGVPNGTVNANGSSCIACGNSTSLVYVREQGRNARMSEQMIARVAEGTRGRLFLSPDQEHTRIAQSADPAWRPTGNLPDKALGFRVQAYGFNEWHQLFTDRQLTSLTTFSDLMNRVRRRVVSDGGSEEYGAAICTYLSLAVGRLANACSSFATWQNAGDFVSSVFKIQGIPIVWDFAEINPFSSSTQNWMSQIEWVARVVDNLPSNVNIGDVYQADAAQGNYPNQGPVIVTDPPYYDNVGYADLSDFFYVWLRPLLRDIYPGLFASIFTPKHEEMTASPRFDNPSNHFEYRLSQTLRLIYTNCSDEFPTSIFYAHKQQQTTTDGINATGWETMLNAVVRAGFQIVGTWPMRIAGGRVRAVNSNALASYVILVCRPRADDAPVALRRQFLSELERELPAALDHLTREGHIAPVDLAQAAIGPGMQVYSRFKRVETFSGDPVSVREALVQINRVIAEYHEQEQGQLDAQSRFCVDWLRQHGYGSGEYGQAEVLAQAHNVAVEAMPRLLSAETGKVKLRLPASYAPNGSTPRDGVATAWEGCMRMAYHLDTGNEVGGGIAGAADVARAMGGDAESVERLARILYEHYDRKNDSANAVRFNNLVTSWQDIVAQAQQPDAAQTALL